MKPLFTVAVLMALSGCAHGPAATDRTALAAKNLAYIKVDHGVALIDAVDGKGYRNWLGDFSVGRLELSPGEHTLSVSYRPDPHEIRSWYLFHLVAEAGHVYLIRSDVSFGSVLLHMLILGEPQLAKISIVDADKENGAAAEILESFGERLTGTEPIQFGDLFLWNPPKDKRALGLSRLRNGRAVSWTPTADQSYSVAITTFQAAQADTPEDFMRLVRQSREAFFSALAGDQTEAVEESLEPITKNGNTCVRFGHVSVYRGRLTSNPAIIPPTAPLGRSTGANVAAGLLLSIGIDAILHAGSRVTLESYGYDCRVPTKKDVGIHFEYSRRSHGRMLDEEMASSADEYFKELKF